MTSTARDSALVDTGISGREQRPRTDGSRQGPRSGGRSSPDVEATDLPPGGRWTRSERERRAKYLSDVEAKHEARERAKTLPAYINACFANPDRHRTYWVYTWKPEDPSSKKRIPYLCGSWKCEHCRQFAGHVLYSRLQEAFNPLDASGVVFVVLTLNSDHHKRGAHDLDGIYREFSQRQNKWMKRLRRWLVEQYGHDMANRWASVTECHKSGMPHVNIAIHHPAWAADLRADIADRELVGMGKKESIIMRGELARHAQECGFGWRCSAEPNREANTEAISGYLVKCVKNADAMHGEIAKQSQIPVMAPKNFRRLRAGLGFVPPKKKGDCTGTVIRRYWTPEGDEQTEPLSTSRVKPVDEWEPTAKWLDAHPDSALPSDMLNAWEDYRDRVLAYNAEVEHCRSIEQVCAWRDEGFRGPTVIEKKGTTREELIEQFTRRVDGSTVAGGWLVLNAPTPNEETKHEQQETKPTTATATQAGAEAHRHGGGRDGPAGGAGQHVHGPGGGPPRGGPGTDGNGHFGRAGRTATDPPRRGDALEHVRIPETARQAEQLAFDVGR